MAKKWSLDEIQHEIARLDELRAQLMGRVANLSDEQKIKLLENAQPKIKPKTGEMEALLQAGYPDMSVKKANIIIGDWESGEDARVSRWPYREVERAQAFLSAWQASPVVVSQREPWTRTRL